MSDDDSTPAGGTRRAARPGLRARLPVACRAAASAGVLVASAAAGAAAPAWHVTAAGTSSADALPRELRAPPVCDESPKYPKEARRRHVEGLTVLRVTVGPDGRIRVMTVYYPSGSTPLNQALDEAVAEALGTCHWDVVAPASFSRPVDLDVAYRWRVSEHEDDH